MDPIQIGGYRIPLIQASALVVGSGAAGYNAADSLYTLGVHDVILVTEGRLMGTSRNTGSDKQTYYKLNLSGGVPDSVYDMARSLMRGGSMHGDIALTDAALSARSFFKLVNLGVPFPMNEYGEYVGYKTDHDETTRATSCGPLTSKFMTEALERSVLEKKIPIFDRHRVIRILKEDTEGQARATGLVTLCPQERTKQNPLGMCVFLTGAIVYAVGGPSAIYADTVYPPSQTSALGVAFEAGAAGANLTESQYGLASTKFRWNLSGTYQQVIPRYFSTNTDGTQAREFLPDAFRSHEEMLHAIFRKGYEWPFDPKKTADGLSSRVDLAVFREKERGRRVFLDYTRNPSCLEKDGKPDFSMLSHEAREYLSRSEALLGAPIERLAKMNRPAIELYASHGIDLSHEPLEIAVCAQHCNGGLAVKTNRESTTLLDFYAVGECAGTFGVYRPGGSALNATQTGSLFAAMDIAAKRNKSKTLSDAALSAIKSTLQALSAMKGNVSRDEVLKRRLALGEIMSSCAAFLRKPDEISAAIASCRDALATFCTDYATEDPDALYDAMINRDILLTQLMFLSAIRDYVADGGKSRGSYLILSDTKQDLLHALPDIDTEHAKMVQNTILEEYFSARSFFEAVRPLPESEQWFETVWNRFRSNRSNQT